MKSLQVITLVTLALAWAAPALAQFGNGCGDTVFNPCYVIDPPVEKNTYAAAQALILGGGSTYVSNVSQLMSLEPRLLSGLNSQDFGGTFLWTQPLPLNRTAEMQRVAKTVMPTYQRIVETNEQALNELANENFGTINLHDTNALGALWAIAQTNMAIVDELRMLRLQIGAETLEHVTHDANEEDATLRMEQTPE